MEKLIVFNHKLYLKSQDVDNYIESLEKVEYNNLIVCPDFSEMSKFKKSKLKIGAQNFSYTSLDADTGEMSLSKLSDNGIKNYIIGHSERRKYHGENGDIINRKLKLLSHGKHIAIVCVGDDKDNLFSEILIKYQLNKMFKNISIDNIVIAYEPVYSIGTGKILSKEKIEKRIHSIKHYLSNKKGKEVKVLYGGSVDEHNIRELYNSDIIDGFLIGKASADINKAKKLLEVVK
jgi:triosephosphate isomerase